jgi:hypothetical protein
MDGNGRGDLEAICAGSSNSSRCLDSTTASAQEPCITAHSYNFIGYRIKQLYLAQLFAPAACNTPKQHLASAEATLSTIPKQQAQCKQHMLFFNLHSVA